MSIAGAHGISRVIDLANLTSVVPRPGSSPDWSLCSRGYPGLRGHRLICVPHVSCHCNNGDITPSLQEESKKSEQLIMMPKKTELNGNFYFIGLNICQICLQLGLPSSGSLNNGHQIYSCPNPQNL